MASATITKPCLRRSIGNDAYIRGLELTLAAHSVGPCAQHYGGVFLMLNNGGSVGDFDVPDVEAGRDVSCESVVSEHGHSLGNNMTMTG